MHLARAVRAVAKADADAAPVLGRGAVVPARAEPERKRAWSTKFELRTPRDTTQVGELPVAHASESQRLRSG